MRKTKYQLPSIPLENPKKVMDTLVAGHKSFKRLYARIYKHVCFMTGNPFTRYGFRRFRQDFFRVQKFCAIFKCPVALFGIKIPQKAIDKIVAVQALENQVVFSFTKMVRQLANRRHRIIQENCYVEVEDLESEGYIGVMDAIYTYDGRNKFSTHCYNSAKNRIGVAVNKAHNNFPWPSSLRKLYRRYEDAVSQNVELGMNAVLDAMQLTNKQRERLQACMVEVHSATNVAHLYKNKDGDSSERNDYTVLAPSINRYRPVETLDESQIAAIKAAHLNDWEMAVLKGHLSGHYGWRSEVAKRFGKTRAAPKVTLEGIKRKVLAQLAGEPEAA
ncbi:MAG: sigma factor [Bacteroidales bacterium]|jgi:DNA-directed RNA polymerase specialized sigma subunit